MLVSIIVSAFNEEEYLPELLRDILEQSYSLSLIELILINSMSNDRTKDIMISFRNNNKVNFYDIKVIDNQKRNQASGFNLGIKNSNGEVVVKIDAHSRITKNFIKNSVSVIYSGESVCGGKRPTIVKKKGCWYETLHLVEENMFGSSISNYRNSTGEKYVNSVFHGMYKREVFRKVGLTDELLGRTEDNELNYRIREQGYKIKYSDNIVSYQYMRSNFKKMLQQKYSNGYWIGLTSHVCYNCLSLVHFIPFLFVLAIFGSTLLSIFFGPIFINILFIPYIILLLILSIITIVTNKSNITNIFIPFLIFMVHISYGIGTLVGIIKGFSWKKYYLKNRRIDYI